MARSTETFEEAEAKALLSSPYSSEAGLHDAEQQQSPEYGSHRCLPNLKPRVVPVLSALYVVLAIAWLWMFLRYQQLPDKDPELPSPAIRQGFISYEIRKVNVDTKHNPFVSAPGPEADRAWHELLQNYTIRVSKSELDALGLTSLELADGSNDSAASLGVYHELHCIKMIRRWIYRDHYHAGEDQAVLGEAKRHMDHCMEVLRQMAICRADTALGTFEWLPHSRTYRPTAVDRGPHQCVKWDGLAAWLEPRAISLHGEGLLRTPDNSSSEAAPER